MTKNEDKIIEEYHELLKKFKPNFSNDAHVRMAKLAGENNKCVKKIVDLIELDTKIRKLKKEALKHKEEFIMLYKKEYGDIDK